LGNNIFIMKILNILQVNWFDADRKCSNLNANLLVLDDDHEKTLLTDHLTRNHRISQRFWDSMWVGINSLSQARRFVRSSNGDSISYMPWLRHEPNNQNGDENCVSFANYGGEWGSGYLDIRCNIELLYMCEMRELNYLDLL
ncbi:hypothetical protein KR009_001977, partial [Drosophila setifemur]